jgi:phosphate transport system permease protein
VVFITVFIVARGAPLFDYVGVLEFVFTDNWKPTADPPRFGIFAMVIGSFLVTGLALIVAVPISLAVGIFMAEMAHKVAARIIRSGIELLAGIPSVVYGLFGFFFLADIIRQYSSSTTGLSALTAGIVLAVMILPTIINITEVSLRALPSHLKEGSLALGATHWQTIARVLMPAARSGIIAGIVLGLGRAVGETMAVLMVAGNAPVMPHGPLSKVRTLTMNIVTDLKYAEAYSKHETSLFTTGIVLFLFILIINIAVQMVLKKTIQERA